MNTDNMHEQKIHGQLAFPYIIYRGNIPEYILSYPVHWHEEFELIYIISGTGIITVQSQTYLCHSGDLFLIPPGQIHSIRQKEDYAMEYFNLLFQFSLLEENQNSLCYQNFLAPLLTKKKTVPSYVPQACDLNESLTPHIRFLINNRKCTEFGYELLIKSHLYAILYHMSHHYMDSSSEEIMMGQTISKLKQLLLYIKEHYSEDFSIEQAASISGFSCSHFMKVFKSITGMRFTEYINHYRLEIAAHELLHSDKKILLIAEDVGFHNFSYFIRSFTKQYGLSPSAYRKQHKTVF